MPWPKRTPKSHGVVHGYRSGLEEDTERNLSERAVPHSYESGALAFIQPEKKRTYTADFFIPPLPKGTDVKDFKGVIIETKGRFLPEDREKHLLIKKQHPNLDIRFVFSNPNTPIRKGSKTTLAHWCDKYGFPWAKKVVPASWIVEALSRNP
jgi:hypothetical protein